MVVVQVIECMRLPVAWILLAGSHGLPRAGQLAPPTWGPIWHVSWATAATIVQQVPDHSVNKLLVEYLEANGYCQSNKAFSPRKNGVLENGTMLRETLADSRTRRWEVCVVFHDVKGAFPAILHNFVHMAMWHYHVPHWMRALVWHMFEGLYVRVELRSETGGWIFNEKELPQGHGMMPTVFRMIHGMMMDLHAARCVQALQKSPGYYFSAADCLVNDLAFADDVASVSAPMDVRLDEKTVRLSAADVAQVVCHCLKEAGDVLHMEFGSAKSRAAWITLGGTKDPQLEMGGGRVGLVSEEDNGIFKYIGWPIHSESKTSILVGLYHANVKRQVNLILDCEAVDAQKAELIGMWVQSMSAWQCLVYEPPDNMIEKTEIWLFDKYQRLLPGLSDSGGISRAFMKARRDQAGLQLPSCATMDRLTWLRRAMTLAKSSDPACNRLYDSEVRAGPKQGQTRATHGATTLNEILLSESTVVLIADSSRYENYGESWLQEENEEQAPVPTTVPWDYDDPERYVTHRRTEDGTDRDTQVGHCLNWDPERRSKPGIGTRVGERGKPSTIIDRAKDNMEAENVMLQMALKVQGRAARLVHADTTFEKINWAKIQEGSLQQRAFMIQARANVLMDGPRTTLLYSVPAPPCPLCEGEPWNVKHVLANCSYVFDKEAELYGGQNRCTWRHDNVLAEIAFTLQAVVRQVHASGILEELTETGILWDARDWEVRADLPELREHGLPVGLPQAFSSTQQRPDIVLISLAEQIIVTLELMVPMEENLRTQRKKKRDRYRWMKGHNAAWEVTTLTVEFGATNGGQLRNVDAAWRTLGLSNGVSKQLTERCGQIARVSSATIWWARYRHKMKRDRLLHVHHDRNSLEEYLMCSCGTRPRSSSIASMTSSMAASIKMSSPSSMPTFWRAWWSHNLNSPCSLAICLSSSAIHCPLLFLMNSEPSFKSSSHACTICPWPWSGLLAITVGAMDHLGAAQWRPRIDEAGSMSCSLWRPRSAHRSNRPPATIVRQRTRRRFGGHVQLARAVSWDHQRAEPILGEGWELAEIVWEQV
eukprot:COSAG06_NODE_837_length_12033_cov_4.155574_3_plen_1051_part_00